MSFGGEVKSKYYSKFRELDSGKGFADMVYIPRPFCEYPALLIELKFNSDAETAIKQIKEKRYTGRLSNYLDNLIMVGINYDKTTKQHTCVIEKIRFNIYLEKTDAYQLRQ